MRTATLVTGPTQLPMDTTQSRWILRDGTTTRTLVMSTMDRAPSIGADGHPTTHRETLAIPESWDDWPHREDVEALECWATDPDDHNHARLLEAAGWRVTRHRDSR